MKSDRRTSWWMVQNKQECINVRHVATAEHSMRHIGAQRIQTDEDSSGHGKGCFDGAARRAQRSKHWLGVTEYVQKL